MNLSWEWKLFILNTFCQSLFLFYTSLTLFIGMRVTLPEVYKDDPETLLIRKILAVLIFANAVGNYLCIKLKSKRSVFIIQEKKIHTRDNNNCDYNSPNNLLRNSITSKLSFRDDKFSGSGIENSHNTGFEKKNTGLSLAGWNECRHCNEITPPRSKHCPLCRSCILKKDHHCFFAGCCIGFHNQRYFIIFCFYGCVGALYSGIATNAYLKVNYEFLHEWGMIAYFPPTLLVFWIAGYVSGTSILFVLFLYWSFFTATLCIYFFVLQMFLVFRGQTKYEFKKNIFSYCCNSTQNIMSVFGPSRVLWVISFLIPSPCIGYFGDGKSWNELICSSKIA